MFDLQKSREATEERLRASGFSVLKDHPYDGLKARVRLAMDGSGSTHALWLNGVVQDAIQSVLPTALAVDDDGDVPVAVFNDGRKFTLLKRPMTSGNYATFVHDFIIAPDGAARVSLFGGTDYSYVLEAILKDEGFLVTKGWIKKTEHIEANPHGCPTLIYLFTDGACSFEDKTATRAILSMLNAAQARVYVHFIGFGNQGEFQFIHELSRDLDNVGFASVLDLKRATSNGMTKLLLPDEMLKWLKSPSPTSDR